MHDLSAALPALTDALARMPAVGDRRRGRSTDGRFSEILASLYAATDPEAVDMDEDQLDLFKELANGVEAAEDFHATVRDCILERYDLFVDRDLERLRNLESLLTDALVQVRHLSAWEPFDRPVPSPDS